MSDYLANHLPIVHKDSSISGIPEDEKNPLDRNKIYESIQSSPNFIAVKYKFVISLGHGCQPAIHLKKNRLRKASFPLDWVATPQRALISLFDTRFDKFLDRDHLVAREHVGNYKEKIVNTFYNLTFFHHFSVGGLETELPIVQDKFDKRIKRLYSILESKYPVLFVRTKLSKDWARQLVDILTTQFPQLKYTLLVVNRETEALTQWVIPNTIKINTRFAADNNAGDPTYDINWQTIFSCFLYDLEDIS